jgi:CheY-like chemotaxis protein
MGVLAALLTSGIIAKPFEVAEAMAKAKTTFIANMSHDLRTPLNAIVSLSQLSRTMRTLPPEIEDYQKNIFESGFAIQKVVNDLLDISNIESGKFSIIAAEYDLPSFILDAANSNLRHTGSRVASFRIVLEDRLPARLVGDSLRVRQIVNNLLRNAVANTKAGSIEWQITTEKDGETVWLVFTISDSSMGIPTEDLDKLFLDYSSMDNQKARSSHGTGLGLALTKKIIDLLKGTIVVKNIPETGTVYTVKLPHKLLGNEAISPELAEKLRTFKSPVAAHRQLGSAAMERIMLPNAKVLVVDDIKGNLDVTRKMIEPYGIKVDGVLSGPEAIDIIRNGEPRYDAIFINRWMQEMDGIQILRVIREEIGSDYAKRLPAIALVTNAITINNAFFMESGFQSVLSKPISILHLDGVIHRWIAPKNVPPKKA